MAEDLQTRIDELNKKIGLYGVNYDSNVGTLRVQYPENVNQYIAALREIVPDFKVDSIYVEQQIEDDGIRILTQFTDISKLYIENNRLTEAGFDELRKFNALEVLKISGSKNFTPKCMQAVTKFADSLESLSASNIRTLDNFALTEYVSLLTNVKHLWLNNTGIDGEGLAEALPTLRNIEYLDLKETNISEKSAATIYALAKLGKLETLELDDSIWSSSSWRSLGAWQPFIDHQISVNRLNNLLTAQPTPEMAEDLARADELFARKPYTGLRIGEKAHQEILNLARSYAGKTDTGRINFVPDEKAIGLFNELDVKGFLADLKALCPEIEFVEIGTFGLSDESLEAIVKHFPNVERLYAQSGNLTSAGLVHLNSLTHVKELDLSYNEGITSLAAVDFSNLAGSLVKLNLESLEITNEDVVNIAKLSNLKELSISHTRINDEGLKELLPKLDKLEVLIITGDATKITPASAALVYALLEKGTLKKYTCFNFGDEWRKAFCSLAILQSGEHEHLTDLINKEIAEFFEKNPKLQKELDEARALLKAPSQNTHEGEVKAVNGAVQQK